jgi:hypothetical protein
MNELLDRLATLGRIKRIQAIYGPLLESGEITLPQWQEMYDEITEIDEHCAKIGYPRLPDCDREAVMAAKPKTH